MQLLKLISSLKPKQLVGPKNPEISALTFDSRKVTPGAMFVAVRGTAVDGHSFIPLLEHSGVAAIVCEKLPEKVLPGISYVVVDNSSIALGLLSSEWFDHPSRKLKLVGVTGTNGKTTTATLIYEMARLTGLKAGLLSTVCNYIETEAVHATQTTPDAYSINELLARMVSAGCSVAAMEVSSHAAHQHRIAGLQFAGGVFSNLTRDHLDYHKTVQAYLEAKKSFFDGLPADAFALVNIDDKVGRVMLQNCAARHFTYSLRSMADFTGRIIESRLDGTLLSLNGHEVETLFTGRFNAYNLTAVFGACCLLGWPQDEVLKNVSRLVPVAGRFQAVRSPKGVVAIVDYAHTPDAVINVLEAIREVGPKRIITVVGCGGNRDAGKRPIMAAEAAKRSERLILTSDNPRFEDPEAILAEMEAGLDAAQRASALIIADRRQAIRTAAALAEPGDVILIAGKGHEDYQEIQGVKHHFDDREEIIAAFAE
ncbi:MAG: UDP-N-acetylmuramoyl-L-alanyl-D-glutamate--2,6-diaminopimelate ligase [Bacteroides sp.]|nr:UDP-N-acetylmuramoyl-L-alanyl-D-glutamate--2,6-diaminopimelate ligase [Bacteroidales bacterium]MBD5325507.1 UDP-N-acetylmuramoyl-L-alanyl-D-glutamate--2,6-diaminopimelate ligase [Bacteroides sp.]MBD5415599.1 UDP-N-acetylmuramoyl-L-alanyl-D-glutamate--2,6-diaminopimelate ligase [Bacteroides sp.]MBD5425614.1 UDP-N-acetylmuramoyl-L-alanyl-D-glutamate--2,6-diaminopimelate ligase [Bacteroides sp.]